MWLSEVESGQARVECGRVWQSEVESGRDRVECARVR